MLSPLRIQYTPWPMRDFLCGVLGERQPYPYTDRRSSNNLQYAYIRQELGWHIDNLVFTVRLLIHKPNVGRR